MLHFGLRRALVSSAATLLDLVAGPMPECIDLADPQARRDAARRVSARTAHSAEDIESLLNRLSLRHETVSADDVVRLSTRALAANLPL